MRVDRSDIIKFVEQRLGFTPTSKTKFWWDTGIAALDAWAFMKEFAHHYHVDIQGGTESVNYGDGEGGVSDVFGRLWKQATYQAVPRTAHFTIDHLVEVANRKKWFDPEVGD